MRVMLGLGSNLGDRAANLWRAVELLQASAHVRIQRISPLYETEPVGTVAQPPFLNAVIQADVRCEPEQLLVLAKAVERRMGRTPGERWGPRVIDVDLLLWGRRRVDTPSLTIPHPELWNRRFVLQPLADLLSEGALRRRVLRRLVEIGESQKLSPYPAPMTDTESVHS